MRKVGEFREWQFIRANGLATLGAAALITSEKKNTKLMVLIKIDSFYMESGMGN